MDQEELQRIQQSDQGSQQPGAEGLQTPANEDGKGESNLGYNCLESS